MTNVKPNHAHFLPAGTVALLSMLGVVAWAQHRLLFSLTFAHEVRRGQLMQTLGRAVVKGRRGAPA